MLSYGDKAEVSQLPARSERSGSTEVYSAEEAAVAEEVCMLAAAPSWTPGLCRAACLQTEKTA